MKKLNRKGFTLIELLAIIVILGIIMVITIPTILDSVKNARQSAFDTAVKAIENYVQQEYDKCVLGDATISGGYNTTILTPSCVLVTTPSTPVIEAAGYSTNDIETIDITIESSGKVKITSATHKEGGKFNGVVNYTTS